MSTQPAPSPKPRLTGAERTRRWRERMRAKGLVPRTVWTYDLNDPVFRARLEADCAKIKGSEEERVILEEIEAMYTLHQPSPDWVGSEHDREER